MSPLEDSPRDGFQVQKMDESLSQIRFIVSEKHLFARRRFPQTAETISDLKVCELLAHADSMPVPAKKVLEATLSRMDD
jgi:hypothetical protein